MFLTLKHLIHYIYKAQIPSVHNAINICKHFQNDKQWNNWCLTNCKFFQKSNPINIKSWSNYLNLHSSICGSAWTCLWGHFRNGLSQVFLVCVFLTSTRFWVCGSILRQKFLSNLSQVEHHNTAFSGQYCSLQQQSWQAIHLISYLSNYQVHNITLTPKITHF